jgi:hypothetical protein
MSVNETPQPITESQMRCRASRTELTLRSKPVLVDFTGTCLLTAETRADRVRLRLSDLHLVADLPDAGGPEDGGTVTLAQDGGSQLLLDDSTSRFANDLVVTLSATVEQPDGVVHAMTKKAAEFSTAGASCPSGVGHYELSEQIDLVLADTPEVTIAHIDSLVLRVEPASSD